MDLPSFVKKNSGFTLIEILVVIAIIAILSILGLEYLFEARKESRDNVRGATVEQLALSIKLLNETSGYPVHNSGIEIGQGGALDSAIVGIYPSFLGDPLEKTNPSGYGYYYDSQFTCSVANQRVVFARLELAGNSNFSQECTASSPSLIPNSWPATEIYIMVVN